MVRVKLADAFRCSGMSGCLLNRDRPPALNAIFAAERKLYAYYSVNKQMCFDVLGVVDDSGELINYALLSHANTG